MGATGRRARGAILCRERPRPLAARDAQLPPGPADGRGHRAGTAGPRRPLPVAVRDRHQQRRAHRPPRRRSVALGAAHVRPRLRRRTGRRAPEVRGLGPPPPPGGRCTAVRVRPPAPDRSRPGPDHLLLPGLRVRADRAGDGRPLRAVPAGGALRRPAAHRRARGRGGRAARRLRRGARARPGRAGSGRGGPGARPLLPRLARRGAGPGAGRSGRVARGTAADRGCPRRASDVPGAPHGGGRPPDRGGRLPGRLRQSAAQPAPAGRTRRTSSASGTAWPGSGHRPTTEPPEPVARRRASAGVREPGRGRSGARRRRRRSPVAPAAVPTPRRRRAARGRP